MSEIKKRGVNRELTLCKSDSLSPVILNENGLKKASMMGISGYEQECDEIDEFLQHKPHKNSLFEKCPGCSAVFDDIERERRETSRLRESIGA